MSRAAYAYNRRHGGAHHKVIADDGTVIGLIVRTARGTYRAVAIVGVELAHVPIGDHPYISAAHRAVDEYVALEANR